MGLLPTQMRTRLFCLAVACATASFGCAEFAGHLEGLRFSRAVEASDLEPATISVAESERIRQAEIKRSQELITEIERLRNHLEEAEEALRGAESRLSADHSRADAISFLAVVRIQVERSAARVPWRKEAAQEAHNKIVEAERQVAAGRYGAALYFTDRAQRLSQTLLDEAELVASRSDTRLIQARRVNLRAGPSIDAPVLSVLEAGTPIFMRAREGEWMRMEVSDGPTGWIHQDFVGTNLRVLGLPAAIENSE